ncbi:MAG: response regulator [Desulfobacterales bacterium]|nr:response regulator [Desulfobacterales bacterium]
MTVKSIVSAFIQKLYPLNSTREDGLVYWRECILHALLGVALVLGLVALVPAFALALKEELWGLLVFDICMYLSVVVLVVFRNWSYELRAAGILIVALAIGIWVTVSVGPLSGGPAWLFTVAVFSGLLLGLKAALIAVVLNGLSFGVIGWLAFNGHLADGQPFFSSLARAVAAGANFLALNAGAAITVSVLVQGLQAMAAKEKAANEIIRKEQARLIEVREDLKNEVEVRKQAEEALRVERDTLDRITRNVGAGLAVISRDYRVVWANEILRKMYGDIEGKSCQEAFNKADDACNGCGVREVFDNGKEESLHEQTGRDLQGNVVYSQIIATPIRDAKGNVTAALELVIPITERKRAEEERRRLEGQLEQARKMEAVATLAGGIAHQFNNLLSAVSGNIELMKLDDHDRQKYDRYFTPIENSIQRMAKLTGQLLAYARGGKYRVSRMSMIEFVRETLPLVEHTIKPSITLETDLPEKVSRVTMDVTQMQTVLSGILSNASEAIEKAGHVLISCRDEHITAEQSKMTPGLVPGDYVVLSVMDDGKGMDEKTRQRIFEPFFSTKFQGRGLGMASVYGIIKNHEGWITVDSKPLRGTTVKIFLPAVKSEALAIKPVRALNMENSGTILVIEDEEMVLDVTCTMLQNLGYRVLAARSGEEALRIADSHDGQIDLALLDIILPDMGGKDIYPRLLASRPNLRVIVCSGYTLNGPAQEILKQGAQGFIQKPYTMAALSEKLSAILNLK